MNALVTGIVGFFVAALGAMCPHEVIYLPALFSVVVAGGYVGGTIFSLQSDGVYDLHIRAGRTISHARDAKLGGIWAYGMVGVPAGAIALLITARIVGIDDATFASAIVTGDDVSGAVRRVAVCLGIFGATVVGGFLGLNLIRVVSERMKAEIQREVLGQIEPFRLLEKGKLLMEERSYAEALEVFRALGKRDATLRPVVWQARALKRLGRISEATEILKDGLRARGSNDEPFRRAVALWNLACYQASGNEDDLNPEAVRSILNLLSEALRYAPEFRESLATDALDADLVPLAGISAFEEWRASVLAGRNSK